MERESELIDRDSRSSSFFFSPRNISRDGQARLTSKFSPPSVVVNDDPTVRETNASILRNFSTIEATILHDLFFFLNPSAAFEIIRRDDRLLETFVFSEERMRNYRDIRYRLWKRWYTRSVVRIRKEDQKLHPREIRCVTSGYWKL